MAAYLGGLSAHAQEEIARRGRKRQEVEAAQAELTTLITDKFGITRVPRISLNDTASGVAGSLRVNLPDGRGTRTFSGEAADIPGTMLCVIEAAMDGLLAEQVGSSAQQLVTKAEVERLVGITIAIGTRQSPSWSKTWKQYCRSKARGSPSTSPSSIYDPAEHDPDFLLGFFDYIGNMAQERRK